MNNSPEHGPSTQSTITAAASSSSSSTPVEKKSHPYDNSNPQQGTSYLPRKTTTAAAVAVPAVGSDVGVVGVPFGRPQSKIPPHHKDERKLFVGGLPSDVTHEEFHSFFEQFGEVLDSVVMIDRFNGRSRGFGFVTFVDPAVSRGLLSMGGADVAGGGSGGVGNILVGRIEMRGKIIEVKSAEPKEFTSPPRRNNNNNGSHMARRERGPSGDHHMYGNRGTAMDSNNVAVVPYGADMIPPGHHQQVPHPQQPFYPALVAGYVAPVYYPPPPPHHPHHPHTVPMTYGVPDPNVVAAHAQMDGTGAYVPYNPAAAGASPGYAFFPFPNNQQQAHYQHDFAAPPPQGTIASGSNSTSNSGAANSADDKQDGGKNSYHYVSE